MHSKKIVKKYLFILLCFLLLVGLTNIVIDPYFHYHKPLNFLAYPIQYQRYQNDGIVKNFDYNAIITGSSMTENFKSSELDNLFEVKSIKVPESGASYKEINDLLTTAFNSNGDIKVVVRGLDTSRFFDDKDVVKYDMDWYPNYLYDNNIFNDVYYYLNKSTLLSSVSVIINTLLNNKTTTFDEYSNWMCDYGVGKEYIKYSRENKKNVEIKITVGDIKKIKDNIRQNVTSLAEEHPETDFYLFFTPYSICYFDNLYLNGSLDCQFEAEKIIIEELTKYNNIHLFSFFDDYSLICDLNNYRDITHYGEKINTYILECMSKGKHQITRDNYNEYCENIKSFYLSFNYDEYLKEYN